MRVRARASACQSPHAAVLVGDPARSRPREILNPMNDLRLICCLLMAITLACCGHAVAQQSRPTPPENVGPQAPPEDTSPPVPAEDKGAEPPPISSPTAPSTAPEVKHVAPAALPPLPNPNDPKVAARELFARKAEPAHLSPRVIGGYADGCLAGAVALPIDGPTWQVMRLSRNRNWGHPSLIEFLERLAAQAPKTGWRGLLVGDLSQPRGGPMLTGHASHQVGLDADIWLTPMPDRALTREEREEVSATMIVAEDRGDVDPQVWTPAHTALIKAAAKDPQVARIFVNAAIKKALCREAGNDRHWLGKVQPWWGHDFHFHVRINCPSDSPDCTPQPSWAGGGGW